MSLSLALPLVLFSLGGRWLDRRAGTFPLFFLLGFLGALLLGGVLAARAVRRVTD